MESNSAYDHMFINNGGPLLSNVGLGQEAFKARPPAVGAEHVPQLELRYLAVCG